MSPKVSVIVPIYNPPKDYLHECIQSILNQTLTDIEIILIDNAALGECPQIAKDYAAKDARIKLFRFDENRGFPGACNQGLDIATGDYVQIVDSDDYISPNACQILYDKAVATDSDMVLLSASTFDDSKKKVERSSEFEWDYLPNKYKNTSFSFQDVKARIFHAPSQAWNKFYKRSFLERTNNRFDQELRNALPDALFSFKNYYNAKSIFLLSDILYYYRVNIATGVVAGLSRENCAYLGEILVFFKKMDEFQLALNVPKEDQKYFAKLVIAASKFFYEMIHSKRRAEYWQMLRVYFKNWPKQLYTENNIAYSGCGLWVWAILYCPNALYVEQRCLRQKLKSIRRGTRSLYQTIRTKIRENATYYNGVYYIAGLPLYERQAQLDLTKIKYFGGLCVSQETEESASYYLGGVRLWHKKII